MVEGGRTVAGQEGVPTEENDEELEGMSAPGRFVGEGVRAPVQEVALAARQVEHLAEVDFQEILRDGKRAPEIEPPMPAVGEESPAQAAAIRSASCRERGGQDV